LAGDILVLEVERVPVSSGPVFDFHQQH
jgi:hypothetical protein